MTGTMLYIGYSWERLERSFGVTGLALAWLQAFLSDRSQIVVFGFSWSLSAMVFFRVLYLLLSSTFRVTRRSLSTHALLTLLQALICNRIDFGNAIFAGLSIANLSKLQSVLNSAARLIGGIPKFSNISSFIRNRPTLHWLPISQRIQFK